VLYAVPAHNYQVEVRQLFSLSQGWSHELVRVFYKLFGLPLHSFQYYWDLQIPDPAHAWCSKPISEDKKRRYVKFEVFTAVTMKNGVFRDVTPCGSCKNRRFGGT
jgi:hypothetical protein